MGLATKWFLIFIKQFKCMRGKKQQQNLPLPNGASIGERKWVGGGKGEAREKLIRGTRTTDKKNYYTF